MKPLYDYKLYSILYVDDEAMSLKYFKANFEDRFRIMTALDASEAFRLFELHKDDIGILIADQRMPSMTGVELLEKVRQQRPKMLRMLATAYSDLDAAIAAVNTGAIYKYISKPWDIPELEITLMRAMEFFIIQGERDALLREKISALHRLMMTGRLISLGLLASGLSHHLRNALVAVKVFLDLAPLTNIDLERANNPDYWLALYKTAQSQMGKITGILDSLGSIPITPPAKFDDYLKLSELASEIVKSKETHQGWEDRAVRVQASTSERPMYVDRKMFCRLFDLLLENLGAVTAKESVFYVVVTEDSQSGDVKLEFWADGLRLPKESLRHVFDPFYVQDTNPKDAGINLLICYFIVYHHGGQFVATVDGTDITRYAITLPHQREATTMIKDEDQFLEKVFATELAWEDLLTS
jgi:two-component system, probable response regulator PhcQ